MKAWSASAAATLTTAFTITTWPSTCPARSSFFRPSSMEHTVAPPTATIMHSAMIRLKSGKFTARPEMASGPTPCPMKMPAMIL